MRPNPRLNAVKIFSEFQLFAILLVCVVLQTNEVGFASEVVTLQAYEVMQVVLTAAMAPVALFFVVVAMKDLRELRKNNPTLRLSGLAALAARMKKHPGSVKLRKHARDIIKQQRAAGAFEAPITAAGGREAHKDDSRESLAMPKGSVPLSRRMRTLSKAEIQEAFASHDVDGSGTLSWDETRELVSKVSTFDTSVAATNYVNGVFEIFDADKSGCLDVEEFSQLLTVLQSRRGADGVPTDAVSASTDAMDTNPLLPSRSGTPSRNVPAEASPVRRYVDLRSD